MMRVKGDVVECDTPLEAAEFLWLIAQKPLSAAPAEEKPRKRRHPNRSKRWTPGEDAYLLKARKSATIGEIARTLGRTRDAVYNRHFTLTRSRSDA